MKTIIVESPVTEARSKDVHYSWEGEDNAGNDSENLEEEWLPQEAW